MTPNPSDHSATANKRVVNSMIIEEPDNRPDREIRRYNPARDLAYNYADLINHMLLVVGHEGCGMAEFEESGLITPEDLAKDPTLFAEMEAGCKALHKYLEACKTPSVEDCFKAIAVSGWREDVSPRARIIMTSVMGLTVLKQMHSAIRDTFDRQHVQNVKHIISENTAQQMLQDYRDYQNTRKKWSPFCWWVYFRSWVRVALRNLLRKIDPR